MFSIAIDVVAVVAVVAVGFKVFVALRAKKKDSSVRERKNTKTIRADLSLVMRRGEQGEARRIGVKKRGEVETKWEKTERIGTIWI